MSPFTFSNIYSPSELVYESDTYLHFHNPDMLIMYDDNYVEFKDMPSLGEFQEALTYLRKFHREHGQKHVKFYFPDGEEPTKELRDYLKKEEIEIGFLELYAIEPSQFPVSSENPMIKVEEVQETNFEEYLSLRYQEDKEFGEEFLRRKIQKYKQSLHQDYITQVIAFYKDIPAGAANVYLTDETAEIDSLFVLEKFRNKGIGGLIQSHIMKRFSHLTVILVADGDDTPREMYQKRNYQYITKKYEAQKVYE